MMHNYYTIETEAVFRQRESQRAAEADARAAMARHENDRVSRVARPLFSLRSLRLPIGLSLKPAQPAATC